MKKIHSPGLEKVLLFCGFSFALTLAGFWQFQHNVVEAEKLARVQGGVGTCFARVTQSFTAAMIREISSPYLKRDFMAMSDECLSEGTKAAGLEISQFTKADKLFNELVSEVYWFHEKVVKVLGAAVVPNSPLMPLNAISEKYSKVESLKLDLQDQLDLIATQYREARLRDELLVGIAFIMFTLSLGLLGWREIRMVRHRRHIESQALSLLNTGHAQAGALVDQLVQNALNGQGMPVAAQVFNDYHGGVLERLAFRVDEVSQQITPVALKPIAEAPVAEIVEVVAPMEVAPQPIEVDARKLLTAQAIRLKAAMEVQEAQINADGEIVAQLLQAFGQRLSAGALTLKGVRTTASYEVVVTSLGAHFTAAELSYIENANASLDGVDVNVIIGMDLIREALINAELRNTLNDQGNLMGAEVTLSFPVIANRSLVNVVKGKKRDLARTLAPSLFN